MPNTLRREPPMTPSPEDRPEPRTRHDLSVALLALAVVIVLALVRYSPPRPAPADAPPAEFSAQRASFVLARVLGDGAPHPAGTAAHARVRERILEELERLDLVPQVQETFAIGPSGRLAVVRNVLARIEGARPGRAVLLVAHYDSVGSSPGAADDGAGVASLLEIARALQGSPPLAKPVVLLFSDAAEAGSIGAAAFADEHPWASEVEVVIELGARGTSGPSLLAELSGPSAALIAALASSWPRPFATSAADLVHKNLPSETDLAVFRERGVPGLGFAFTGGLARYHTSADDLRALDLGSVQHQGEQALAAVRAFADSPGAFDAGGDCTFADVLALWILRWPMHASSWLAALALALALCAWWRARREDPSLPGPFSRASASALALFAATIAATLAAAGLLGAGLALLGRGGDPASSSPLAAHVGLAALAGAIALAAGGSRFAVKTGPRALALTAALACSSASLALAFALPRASHLALVPALAAGAVGVVFGTPPASAAAWRRRSAITLPLIATAVTWIPIAISVALGFGFGAPHLEAVPLVVLGVALAPAAASSPRAARTLARAAGGAAALAWLVILVAPARSSEAPQWLDVRYILDGDRNAARVEVSTFGAPLPAAMLAIAPLAPASTPPFPWLSLDRSLYAAEAPVWNAPLPELVWIPARTGGGPERLLARIASPRGASRLHLHLPAGVELVSAQWGNHRVEGGFLRSGSRGSSHLFFAIPPEGVEVELLAGAETPFDLWLLDQDWSLPPEAMRLANSRPPGFARRSDGDVSISGRRFQVEPGREK